MIKNGKFFKQIIQKVCCIVLADRMNGILKCNILAFIQHFNSRPRIVIPV